MMLWKHLVRLRRCLSQAAGLSANIKARSHCLPPSAVFRRVFIVTHLANRRVSQFPGADRLNF
jgi:hypothetical protein